MIVNNKLMFGLGGMSITAYMQFTLLSEWPDGDSGKAREAAALWRQIADTVEESLADAKPLLAKVMEESSGLGIDAFERHWNERLKPYPPQVANYARLVAKAYDDYAAALEHVKFSMLVMAAKSWAEFILFNAWPEVNGEIIWLARRAIRKEEVTLLVRMLAAVIGGLFFSSIDTALHDLANVLTGKPVTLKDTAATFLKDFVDVLIFYQGDPANFGPLNKVLPQNPVFQHYFWYLVGSNGFTISDKALNNPSAIINDPASLLPTWQEEIAKLIVPTGQLRERIVHPK